ncbi:phospholipase D family protein [Xenophilus sp.]|uniref:phospholipase D family protein n=1 Tax=Xenophilus sp. TaxID=1873499 RepID=UPI0037DC8A12
MLAVLAAVALGACASLGPRGSVPEVLSLAPYLDGELGAAVRASTPQGTPAAYSGFQLLHDGPHALDARLAVIDAARRSLDLQYYIFACDSSGRQVMRALRAAARRGVRVRLLLDDLNLGEAEDALLRIGSMAGFEVRLFNPLPARGGSVASRIVRSVHELRRINHRMHNKLLIADGVVSISGGRNVADEYFMRAKNENFIDMDVLAAGAVVPQQAAVFDSYWNSEHSYPITALRPPAPPAGAARGPVAALDLVPGERDAFGNWPLRYQIAMRMLDLVWARAQVLADPPEKVRGRAAGPLVSDRIQALAAGARSELFIGSPYFVPRREDIDVLRRVRQRGVEVTLVTNAAGATDEPLVHARYVVYRDVMLDLGVNLYEMSPQLTARFNTLGSFMASRGSLHSKLAAVDERWFYVGSMNFDRRSALLNTESGLLIDSPTLVSRFMELVHADKLRSAYHVSRDERGRTRWTEYGLDGRETVLPEEPNMDWMRKAASWFWLQLVDEDWL